MLTELIEKINALYPDIVLLPGDITTRSHVGDATKSRRISKEIKAPLGISVTVNHEYYGGVLAASNILKPTE
jgi:predicted MPP superfamily phosphohydrolase